MTQTIIKATIPYHAEPPHEPQGNGVFIPTLLSILVHGLVIAFVYFSNLSDIRKPPVSIETTLISPEQLADLQQQIMANRANNQQQEQSHPPTQNQHQQNSQSVPSTINDEYEPEENNLLQALANQFKNPKPVEKPKPTNHQAEVQVDNDETLRQLSKPIFNKSADVPDNEIDERLLEKQRQYEQEMERLAKQIDQQTEEEMRRYIEGEKQKQRERIAKVNEFKKLEQQQDLIEEQNRKELQEAAKSIAELKALQQAEKNSNPLSVNSRADNATEQSNQASGSASQPTAGFTNQIITKIQRHFNPPLESQNKTTVLTLRLDSNGNVLSAKASGSDKRVNQAAEDAAFEASPLPIDPDNPQAYRSIRVTIRGH